jgi:hypothetical protein
MSISNSITGATSGGMDQMFALLKLASDPQAYSEKIQALKDATEQHAAIVALVGPADEVLALREEVKASVKEAKDKVSKAKKDADEIKSKAEAAAAEQLTLAQKRADDILALAEAARAEANAALKEAKNLDGVNRQLQKELVVKVADAERAQKDAITAQDAAKAAEAAFKEQAEALRKRAQAFAAEL